MCKFYSQTSQINNCKTLQPSSWQMIYWHDIQMCFASALMTGVPELVTKVINGSLYVQPWKTGNGAISPLQFIEDHLSLYLQEVTNFFPCCSYNRSPFCLWTVNYFIWPCVIGRVWVSTQEKHSENSCCRTGIFLTLKKITGMNKAA